MVTVDVYVGLSCVGIRGVEIIERPGGWSITFPAFPITEAYLSCFTVYDLLFLATVTVIFPFLGFFVSLRATV